MPRNTSRRSRTELYVAIKLRKKTRQGVYAWKRYNPETASYNNVECGTVITTGSDHQVHLLGILAALASVQEGTAVTCVLSHPVVLRQAQNLATLERDGFRSSGKTIANVELWQGVARLVSLRSVGFRLARRVSEDRRVVSELTERANHALDVSNAR